MLTLMKINLILETLGQNERLRTNRAVNDGQL